MRVRLPPCVLRPSMGEVIHRLRRTESVPEPIPEIDSASMPPSVVRVLNKLREAKIRRNAEREDVA